MADCELLDVNAIRRDLKTRILGCKIIYRAEIGSTNDLAKQLADAGEAEGAVVLADYQSAGRGRMARSWFAPACSSVLMSIVLKPRLRPDQIGRLTMAASLGVCEAIRTETRLDAQIKWPNDILLNGKKCAGILAEASSAAERVEYVIIGLGANANFSAAKVEGLAGIATTIADELGHVISRERLTIALLQEIEQYYLRLRAGDAERLRAEWKSRLMTLGRRVRADTGDRVVEGIAQDVDADGALLVEKKNGEIERLIAGDVTLRM